MTKARRPVRPVEPGPFTAGRVLAATASLTTRTAGPLLALVAITQGPWAVLELSGVVSTGSDSDYYRWSGLYGLVFGVLQSGAIIWLVHGAVQGEHRSVTDCLRRAARSYLSLLGAALQSSIWTLLYLLLLVVPGILKALSYAVVLPVVLLEDRRASAALARSTQLMDGHRGVAFVATCTVLPLLVGPFVAGLLWPALDASAAARSVSGLVANVLGLPFEVLGVALYVQAVRAHAAYRREVLESAGA